MGRVYHHTRHDGLCVPELPRVGFSPSEMFEIGVAKSGGLLLPANPDLAYEFLDVRWRTIQHYGVEVDGLRYDGSGLTLYRTTRSPYGGVHAGKWPIFVDNHDIRHTWFQDPDSHRWHQLVWEHGACLNQPFSRDAADYAKRIAVREHRHFDPAAAVRDLLLAWSRDDVATRRDRALARRLSAHRPHPETEGQQSGIDDERDTASVPGVAELLDELATSRTQRLEVVDDVDVFDRYYAEHPDEDVFEVFDE